MVWSVKKEQVMMMNYNWRFLPELRRLLYRIARDDKLATQSISSSTVSNDR